jgi:signal peptidase II
MSVLLPFLLSGAIVLADQLIKAWVSASLAPDGSIWAIENVMKLTYVENRGAAFGILQGQRALLSLAVLAVVGAAAYMIAARKLTAPLAVWPLAMVIGGGLGNLIDRLRLGYVVDYIDINPLFSYPMFNLADCCVVCGTILIAVYLFFFEERDKKKAAQKPEA